MARIECKFSQTTPNCWWVSDTVNSIRINLFPPAKFAAKNLKFKIRNWVRVQCLGSIGFLDQVTPCPAVPHSFVLPSHNVNSVGYKLYSTDSTVGYSINSIKYSNHRNYATPPDEKCCIIMQKWFWNFL